MPESSSPASLNPTLLQWLSRALRPDFAQTAAARRTAAGVLVLLAALAALRPDPAAGYRDVAVAVTDLRPGTALAAGDVRLEKRSAATIPDGALSTGQLVGSILAGAARRGEVLTDARVLGSRLAGLSAGPDARVVPLHLADAAVLDVVRPGDVVDVLGATAADPQARPRMLAAGAVVVTVCGAAKNSGPGDRVVLVALPAAAATALAGASLVQTVTLTLH